MLTFHGLNDNLFVICYVYWPNLAVAATDPTTVMMIVNEDEMCVRFRVFAGSVRGRVGLPGVGGRSFNSLLRILSESRACSPWYRLNLNCILWGIFFCQKFCAFRKLLYKFSHIFPRHTLFWLTRCEMYMVSWKICISSNILNYLHCLVKIN